MTPRPPKKMTAKAKPSQEKPDPADRVFERMSELFPQRKVDRSQSILIWVRKGLRDFVEVNIENDGTSERKFRAMLFSLGSKWKHPDKPPYVNLRFTAPENWTTGASTAHRILTAGEYPFDIAQAIADRLDIALGRKKAPKAKPSKK